MTNAVETRGAIRSHSTSTVDTPWDGPAAVAAAPNDSAVLRYMHAWVDSDGDADEKSSYKFPHHAPRSGSAANLPAVRNGLARLSQANIPDSDRSGVEAHLRRHLRDGGGGDDEENAEEVVGLIRADHPLHYIDVIRGVQPLERVSGDGNTMVGYPIVFGQWTEINSWEGRFFERVDRRSVNRTLKDRGDRVKVQFDHGMHPFVGSFPLGRPRVMQPEDYGLRTETPLADTSYNRDIIKPLLLDGAIDGMSFRFQVMRDEWDMEPERSDHNPDGLPERTITELRLFEFGPVTYPAYEATQVGIRSAAAFKLWLETPPDKRAEVLSELGMRTRDVPDDSPQRHSSSETEGDSPEGHSSSTTSTTSDSPQGRSQAPDEAKEPRSEVEASRLSEARIARTLAYVRDINAIAIKEGEHYGSRTDV